MRRFLAGVLGAVFGALALAATAPHALAADVTVALPTKAPVKAAPVQPWRGFFIGVHGGYGWGNHPVVRVPDASYVLDDTLYANPIAGAPRGVVAGAQWGTNYQFDRFLLGTESDFSYTDIKRAESIIPGFFNIQNNAEQRLRWFGTTRLRAGLITDNVLIYATGGLASGRAESSFSRTSPATGFFGCFVGANRCPSGSAAGTLWGWTVGGGIEIARGPWSFKVEYLHYDLGTLRYTATDPTQPPGVLFVSTHFAGDIVRAGVNYRFDWTPLDLVLGR